MRPYIMTLYEEASSTGAPIMRPLFYDFWMDDGAQEVDDELMFGPDYLVAPQLTENGTSRVVYLPKLPAAHAWHNVFTGVETDTSAGGRNITEQTPLSGDGFGTFPLYHRRPQYTYPPPPAPKPPPKCDGSCTITKDTDIGSGVAHKVLKQLAPSASDADCCAQCKSNSRCNAFVRGPDGASGPVTCFLLAVNVTSVRKAGNRNFGCVRF
jgi:hypothetical protein